LDGIANSLGLQTIALTKKHRPFNQKLSFWVILFLITLFLGLYRYYLDFSRHNNTSSSVPVILAQAENQDVPIYIFALGSVTPTYNVTVMSQINGVLQQVLFREGQMVKAGDVLAQIDPRPYQAQLDQYEGQLTRDQALYANALIDLNRYQTLWKQNSISQQTLATQQSLVTQYAGAIQIDKGLIEATKINLIYCRITAPIDGRIGLRLVDPGNFVQTSNTTGIAVINTLNPITVIFTIPEDSISEVQQKIYSGETLSVYAYDRQQTTLLTEGKVITIDNQIDSNTGTVKLRAQFQNKTNILFPYQFVNIRLLVKTLQNAIVVPTAAIQFSSNGSFVYTVSKDNKVSAKPVKTGVAINNKTVITSGISSGDSVVIEGADKLVDGAKANVIVSTHNTQRIPA
jgi:multidrug efflux system membrane fusion protein